MPNLPISQEKLNTNGHYPSNRDQLQLLEPAFNDASTPVSATQALPDNREDWSSVTKELIDTLPRVWTRGLLYSLVVFAAIILPWATLSKVDETGSARGRLEPKGKTLKLDAPLLAQLLLSR